MVATDDYSVALSEHFVRDDTLSKMMHDSGISSSSSSTHATNSPQKIYSSNDFEDYDEPPVPRPMNSWGGPGSPSWAARQLAWNTKHASDPIKLAQWPAPLPEEEYWGPVSEQPRSQPQDVISDWGLAPTSQSQDVIERWGPAPTSSSSSKQSWKTDDLDWDGRHIFGPFAEPFYVHNWLNGDQERLLEELAFDGCSTVYALEFFERIYGQRTRREWAQVWCAWDSVLQRYYHVEDFLAEGGEGGWWPVEEVDGEAGVTEDEEAVLERRAAPEGYKDFDAYWAAMWQRKDNLTWGAELEEDAESEGDAGGMYMMSGGLGKDDADRSWGAEAEAEDDADTETEAEPATAADLSDDADLSGEAVKQAPYDGYHMHEVEGGEVVEVVVDDDAVVW